MTTKTKMTTSDVDSLRADLTAGIALLVEHSTEQDTLISRLEQENDELWARNAELEQKQRRADDSFGRAIFNPPAPKRGPQRINRPKLTAQEVKDIRQAHAGGMRQRDLAANYGVNPATISRTVRGIYNS